MDTMFDYLIRLWPVVIAIIGLVAWLVRVDAKTMAQANELSRIEREGQEELARLEKRIDDRRKEDMSRIERQLDTMASDIKTLLQRVK